MKDGHSDLRVGKELNLLGGHCSSISFRERPSGALFGSGVVCYSSHSDFGAEGVVRFGKGGGANAI